MFDWIVALMGRSGYLGVGGLMFAENVLPPIPSELVMPLAGFLSAQGSLSLIPTILLGTVGSVLGALLWCYIGILIGEERLKAFAALHGRWLTISPREVDPAADWFRRYGWRAVFVGRMVPGVRTFISVPAGVARMPLGAFGPRAIRRAGLDAEAPVPREGVELGVENHLAAGVIVAQDQRAGVVEQHFRRHAAERRESALHAGEPVLLALAGKGADMEASEIAKCRDEERYQPQGAVDLDAPLAEFDLQLRPPSLSIILATQKPWPPA